MKSPNESKEPPRGQGETKLFAIALVLGGLALAADLTWMVPHQASAASQPSESTAARDEPSATPYFPSQFTLQAKEAEPPAPTF